MRRSGPQSQPDEVVAHVAGELDVLLRAAAVDPFAVVGIGVVAPGALDLVEGAILVSRSLERWQGYALRDALAAATALPVLLDNGATAAVHGDALCRELIQESADYLADAAVTVANLLDLDSLVLAGPSFTTAGAIYRRAVQERIAAEFFPAARHDVRVMLSGQVADAAAVGAAALVLQEELAPRHLVAGG